MTVFDETVRHAIYIERYKAQLVRDILRKLRGVSNDIYQRVAASDLDQMTRRELNRFLAEINRIIRTDYGPITADIEKALGEFGVYERDWQARMLRRFNLVADISIPSDADIIAAATSRPFQGKLLREWLTNLPVNTARRVRETIRQGFTDGVSPLEIARQIRGTRANPGIMDVSARGAEAMARTAVAHTSNAARERLYKANKRIKSVQWVSVLDHRTTPICRSRDGEFYPVDDGPRPPAHINCRSTVVPVTDTNRARLERRQTYQEWLQAQSKATQEDVLGKSKAALFRSGEFTVDKFVNKHGEEYTLEQLRAKDKEAFDSVLAE